jgi:MPBQ/MSBQ methyltransferase
MKTGWERESSTISRGAADLASAFDASNVTFRVLRAFGWGPLLNLGYYPFGRPVTLLNFLVTSFVLTPILRLPAAQLKLVKKAVALLDLPGGRRLLDIGCGRGTSTYIMASAFPHTQVTGVDLLADNLAVARTLYGNVPNLRYLASNAMHLDFPDRSFDRVLCLEAAFQFPDRATFLSEISRVTDAGARVAILDFMWKSDEARDSCQDARSRLVRRIWQWEDFDSVRQYQDKARANGFQVKACLDWSSHVTAPILSVFLAVAWLARRAWGRAALRGLHPLLRAITDEDWREFIEAARAHHYVYRYVQYVALVLVKNAG